MAINIRYVTQSAPATNTTQDYTVSSFGTVQAVIFISGTAGAADQAPLRQAFGFWDTTNSVSWHTYGDDGVAIASSKLRSDQDTSNVIEHSTGDSGVTRSATCAATTDGITLTWAGSDTSVQPSVIAILINGINGAQCGADAPNASDAGTSTVTTTGITPKVVFAGQNRANAADAALAWITASFGFAYNNDSSIEQMSLAWNQITTILAADLLVDSTRVSSNMGSASVDTQQEITAMTSGSFTHTTRNVDGSGAENSDLYYLALDFDDAADTFSSTTPTGAGDWSPYSGGNITPTATIMLSSFSDFDGTRVSNNKAGFFGVYVADGSNDTQIGWCHEDNPATNSNTSGRQSSLLFNQDETAGTPDFTANNPTFSAGEITYASANINTASQGSYVLGIAFGTIGNPYYYYAQQ